MAILSNTVVQSTCSIFFSSIYGSPCMIRHLTCIPVFGYDRRHVLEWHDMLNFELAIRLEKLQILNLSSLVRNDYEAPLPALEGKVIPIFSYLEISCSRYTIYCIRLQINKSVCLSTGSLGLKGVPFSGFRFLKG